MSYDGYLTDGCDTGLDGPFVCEPCYDGHCELCEPERCECECNTFESREK